MTCFRSLVPVVGLVALAAGPRAFAALQDSDPADTPTLSVSTRLVQVDVIVRHDDGPVEGLPAADFVIYDDGRAARDRDVRRPPDRSRGRRGDCGPSTSSACHHQHPPERGPGPAKRVGPAHRSPQYTITVDSTVTQPEVDVGSIEIQLSDGDFARYRESGYEVFRFVNGSGRTGYLRVVVRSGSNQAAGSLWIPLN